MKCLHVIHRYWPALGGSEKYFTEISERLAADGNQVIVFTTDAIDIQHFWLRDKERIKKPFETRNGVAIRRFRVRKLPKQPQAQRVLSKLPGTPAKSLFSFPSPILPGLMLEVRRAEKFDIVHATALPYDSILYAAYVIARRQKIPLVYSPFIHLGEVENDEVRKNYTRRHQLELLRKADKVIVQTVMERDFLLGEGFSPEKILLLGMGINPWELEGGKAERFRKKYGIAGPIVCYIGPKTYDKGTFHLVNAMDSLWSTGNPSTLVLAGAEIEDFKNFFSKLKNDVRSKCLLLDYVTEDEKSDLLDAANVLVLPSRSDSFGIVLLESWFYGKPVIGARAGGIPGVIRDGVDGILVPFGNETELAVAIKKTLVDRKLARKLGLAGREKVLREFTWDRKYAVVNSLYQQLCGVN